MMTQSKDIKKENSKANKKEFRTSIGGQALIEGIMMRGPSKYSVVVRSKEGLVEKTQEYTPLKEKFKLFGLPFIRGVVNFGSSMALGVRSIMFSADQMPDDELGEATKFDRWIEEKLGNERAEKIIITIGVVIGIAVSVGLFMLLPTLLAGFVAQYVESVVIRNLIEGAMRIIIFLTYLWLTSKISYMRRVWQYHGAEHKAIYCYEKELPLTIENVKQQSSLHPRCGTSFMFIVMVVSILVFSVISWNNLLIRFVLRIALLPVVVSISYELIKLAGRYDNILTSIISAPGKALQRITTKEPDDDMIEVAIKALENVIPVEEEKTQASW
ncbi:MAG: DUF1385 domain-containing protein [Oscillospiraceae bacterium]|nr:DUF1385 domain-containing protein [Oscillospiraceae bacterium]